MHQDRVTAEAAGVTGAVVQDTAVREVVLVEAAVEVMVAMMAVNKKNKSPLDIILFRFSINYKAI